MMQTVFNELRELNTLSLLLRFLMACVSGGIVGWGRGKAQHAAGLRTHALVCVGSTAVMILNQYLFQTYQTGDVARLGAQVISGIGFLGAGSILVRGDKQIHGLTTAAGLWASACLGLVIGAGYYEEAIIMLLVICFVMFALNIVDGRYLKNKYFTVYVELDSNVPLSEIIKKLRNQNARVTGVQEIPSKNPSILSVELFLDLNQKTSTVESAVDAIANVSGVHYAGRV